MWFNVFKFLIRALVSTLIAAIFAPKPKKVDAPQPEKENATPIASEKPIPVLHGTAVVPLNVVAFGVEDNELVEV